MFVQPVRRSTAVNRYFVAIATIGLLGVGRSAAGHGGRDDAIGRAWTVLGGADHIDLAVDIDLPGRALHDLRARIDTDADGRLSAAESDAWAASRSRSKDGIALRVDGREVTLSPLYRAEIDASPRSRRGRLRLSWFASTPAGLRAGSEIAIDDRLWPHAPSVCRLVVTGRDGLEWQAQAAGEVEFAPQARRTLLARCRSAPNALNARQAVEVTAPPAAGPTTMFDGATRLAERLALHWSAILDDAGRAGIAGLHRELRAAGERVRTATHDDARRRARADRARACDKLLGWLEALRHAVRIDLAKPASKPLPPVSIPGDAGAVLLRVVAGGVARPQRAIVHAHDFSVSEFATPAAIGPLAAGTHWVLVELANVPHDTVGLTVSLLTADGAKRPVWLRVTPPRPARLRVSVLDDDTGRPTPAMVQLVWKTCGLDRRPSTAIDLTPQFNGQGRLTSQRPAILPGALARSYWCVDGPFDMAVPPGEWEIAIRRGAEHTAIIERFTLRAGEREERIYRPRRWIDMPARGWFSGDDHVHCRILSDADADRLMSYVRAEDIWLANVVKMGDIRRTFFEQRGFGRDFRVIRDARVLSPGQECPRTHQQIGHTLAMNTTSLVRDTEQYYLYDTVFDAIHAQGGLTGYAHVNADLFFVHRDMSVNVPRGKVDFAEVLQFGNLGTTLWYEFLDLGMPLTAASGSDIPWGGTIGEGRMLAYLGRPTFTADAWFDAVRAGRTFVTSGPMLELDVEGALPGATLEIDADRAVRVRARIAADPARGGARELEIVAHGEVVASRRAGAPKQRDIAVEIDVPIAGGAWIAARGTGADGSVAHTTPVYVVRPPLRFWNHAAAAGLIGKRERQLAEIESIIAAAQRAVAEGTGPYDVETWQLARQGGALLERVAAARKLWSELRETHAKETQLRRR